MYHENVYAYERIYICIHCYVLCPYMVMPERSVCKGGFIYTIYTMLCNLFIQWGNTYDDVIVCVLYNKALHLTGLFHTPYLIHYVKSIRLWASK